MQLTSKIILISLLLIAASSKFSDKVAFNLTQQIKSLKSVQLSFSFDNKFVAALYDVTINNTDLQQQKLKLFNSNGVQVCAWEGPQKLNGILTWTHQNLLLVKSTLTVIALNSTDCSSVKSLPFPEQPIWATVVVSNAIQYVAMSFKNKIQQYVLDNQTLIKTYLSDDKDNFIFKEISYSENHDYLYGTEYQQDQPFVRARVITYKVGQEKATYKTDKPVAVLKVLPQGSTFFGTQIKTAISAEFGVDAGTTLYKYDIATTVPQEILPVSDTVQNMKVCTKDNLFAVLDQHTPGVYTFVVYNTTTKAIVQNLTLNYVPVDLMCSSNDFSISDSQGSVRIIEFTEDKPTPTPDPDPKPDDFPIWAIIVICVGGLLIIGLAVFIVYKRKQKAKHSPLLDDEQDNKGKSRSKHNEDDD